MRKEIFLENLPKRGRFIDWKNSIGHKVKFIYNNIEGYIVKKPNFYLGSLLITCVDGKDCEQFVQSFPKIHYQNSENTIGDMNFIPCLEKLDGSNIILYGLKDADGKTLKELL